MTDRALFSASPRRALNAASRSRRRSAVGWIVEVAKYLLLVILAISFMLPLYWMATSALKDDPQVYRMPPAWIPNPVHWNNFPNAWMAEGLDFNLFLFNTVVKYAVPSTLGAILSSAIVAYGFARLRWRCRDVLFSICMMTMMVPGWVTLIPLFITFKKMGWINTYRPLVVPAFFGNAYFIFMLRQFFLTIPQEMSDAARIDGANELGILFRIILPLSRPALAVVTLFQFMWAWNDYLGPMIYVGRRSEWTLTRGIEYLRDQTLQVGTQALVYPYLMAVSTIVTIPIVIAFFFAQRTFIEGISLTGLKG
jgi:multiple sugar transport system permease protein